MAAPPHKILIIANNSSYLIRPLPTIFADAGADVMVATSRGSACEHYVRRHRHVSRVVYIDFRSQDLLANLEDMVASMAPSLLLVAEERIVERILATDRRQLPHCHAALGLGDFFRSRATAYQWALDQGLPVAEGGLCHSPEEAMRMLGDFGELYMKLDGTGAGTGVCHVCREQEITRFWERSRPAGPVTVQRALSGPVGVTEIMARHGEVLAWVSSEKWRTMRVNGPSIARRLDVQEGMHELVTSLALAAGMHGLFGFDWIRCSEGIRIIEIHPRISSGFATGKWAGVDFSEAARCLLDGSPFRVQRPDPGACRHKPVCCYFPEHLALALRRRSWADLRYWLPGGKARSWAMAPWHSPGLVGWMLAHACVRAIRRWLHLRR